MKHVFLMSFFAIVYSGISAPLPLNHQRKLGPEWVKEKDGNDYVKKLNLIAIAQDRQSGTLCYSLPLEDHKRDLFVTENNDLHGIQLAIRMSGSVDKAKVKKDEKPGSGYPDNMTIAVERSEIEENAIFHSVLLGQVKYYDLNGDGMIDGMQDFRVEKEDRSFINMVNEDGSMEWVRIKYLNRNLSIDPVIVGHHTENKQYVFEKGKWREWTTEDQRKREGLDKPKDK